MDGVLSDLGSYISLETSPRLHADGFHAQAGRPVLRDGDTRSPGANKKKKEIPATKSPSNENRLQSDKQTTGEMM